MSDEWPETDKIDSPKTFTEWLSKAITRSSDRKLIYRGQPNSQWHLQPSIDRKEPKGGSHSDRLRLEERTIQEFCSQAPRFLGYTERLLLKGPRTTCMMVMQHFGAPTRLVDWTYSPAVAAYFAGSHYPHLDGTIWWIEEQAVVEYCKANWDGWGITERHPSQREGDEGQVNLDYYIFRDSVPKFVTLLDTRVLRFSRIQAQRAKFTLGGQLNVDHDTVLANRWTEGKRGRITIKANMKNYILDSLELLGIDAVSLEYPGADKVGSTLAPEPKKEDVNPPADTNR